MHVDDGRLLAIVDAIGNLVAGRVLVEPGEVWIWIRDLAGLAFPDGESAAVDGERVSYAG